jgi:hypothetical protein
MKVKHTPGPWKYKKSGFKITIGNESTRHDYLDHDYTVAVINDNSFQAEANAKVLASSPALLKALKGLVEWMDASGLIKTRDGGSGPLAYKGTEYGVVTEARDAIARAEA